MNVDIKFIDGKNFNYTAVSDNEMLVVDCAIREARKSGIKSTVLIYEVLRQSSSSKSNLDSIIGT